LSCTYHTLICSLDLPLTLYSSSGTDHPAGKWSQRHLTPATAVSVLQGHDIQLDEAEKARVAQKKRDKEQDSIQVAEVDDENDVIDQHGDRIANTPAVATAVNEALTLKSAFRIFIDPLTWLPALAYMTTFGFELAGESPEQPYIFAHPLTVSNTS
jgi:MFS transporter, NNP family, nitrate/nitrite transporter